MFILIFRSKNWKKKVVGQSIDTSPMGRPPRPISHFGLIIIIHFSFTVTKLKDASATKMVPKFKPSPLRIRSFCTKTVQQNPHHWPIKQITKTNFNESLSEIKNHISSSDFIAVSLQNTGSFSSPWHRVSTFDTPETAYLKAKFAAERFQILQFAICPFKLQASKVIAYPWVLIMLLLFLLFLLMTSILVYKFVLEYWVAGIIFICFQEMSWRWGCHLIVLLVKHHIWLQWRKRVLILIPAYTMVSYSVYG